MRLDLFWDGGNTKPNKFWEDQPVLVTIRCITYNHEPFIRKCLEGFVMQRTNFKFVAVVHDDASTDGTADIIREYEQKYPDIIKPIYETENQYSKHDGSIGRIMNAHMKGKYIACCEGDDYWTDPLKLQKQVDFLESHPDYVAVADNGLVLNTIIGKEYLFNEDFEHDVTVQELVEKRRFPTAGVVYRLSAREGYSDKVKYPHDTTMWCWLASKGKFRYFPTVTSVYRRGNQGVTEYTGKLKWAETVEKWNLELIELFGDKYDTSISYEQIWQHYFRVFTMRISGDAMRKSFGKCMKYKPVQTVKELLRKVAVKVLRRG